MIQAGKIRMRVIIQEYSATATRDAAGHVDETTAIWSELGRRWAEILPQAGREFRNAKQIQADLSHLIRMRYDSTTKTITTKMRLQTKLDSRNLTILSVKNVDERNRVMELVCREDK